MSSSKRKVVSVVFTISDEDGVNRSIELRGHTDGETPAFGSLLCPETPKYFLSFVTTALARRKDIKSGVLLASDREKYVDISNTLDAVPDEYSVESQLCEVAGVFLRLVDRII